MLLQKKIFLAQDFGLPLGYGFGWYIHSPYSTDLTEVVYQILPEGFKSIDNYNFANKYKSIIDDVNRIEKTIHYTKLNNVQWYELIASIAYWYNRGKNTENDIVIAINDSKPQFNDEDIKKAFKIYISIKNKR